MYKSFVVTCRREMSLSRSSLPFYASFLLVEVIASKQSLESSERYNEAVKVITIINPSSLSACVCFTDVAVAVEL